MRACRVKVSDFRGVKDATIVLPDHAVLIGDNNTGKTTILESLDLALGPDRLNRTPPIDEHDFFEGRYLPKATPDTSTEGEDVSPEGGDAGTIDAAIGFERGAGRSGTAGGMVIASTGA